MQSLALTFEAMQIRVVTIDEEPWWVLADVCAVLEIANPRNVTARLDPDEKDAVQIMDAMGRGQETTIISEPGLYKLLQTSRKPQAKRFDRWVRHEVLPTIRKTGSYGSPSSRDVTHDQFIEAIREIVRPLAGRFDGQDVAIERLETRVVTMDEQFGTFNERLGRIEFHVSRGGRRRLSEADKADHIDANRQLGGRCACCGISSVTDDSGNKSPFAEFDHYYTNSDPRAASTWLICKPCHGKLTTGKMPRHEVEAQFRAYQEKRLRLPHRQPKFL
jgi:prophage antirepressor-like protein